MLWHFMISMCAYLRGWCCQWFSWMLYWAERLNYLCTSIITRWNAAIIHIHRLSTNICFLDIEWGFVPFTLYVLYKVVEDCNCVFVYSTCNSCSVHEVRFAMFAWPNGWSSIISLFSNIPLHLIQINLQIHQTKVEELQQQIQVSM